MFIFEGGGCKLHMLQIARVVNCMCFQLHQGCIYYKSVYFFPQPSLTKIYFFPIYFFFLRALCAFKHFLWPYNGSQCIESTNKALNP